VVKILKIIELDWLMKNRDLLDKDDYKILQSYDLFNQYDNGELKQNAIKMLVALGTVIGMYEKYTK
jgi:hypothetical protein